MGRKFGFSFSWKRAVGLSSAKARLSRQIGIPLTRGGMERKMGRMVMKGAGCCIPFVVLLTTIVAAMAKLLGWL